MKTLEEILKSMEEEMPYPLPKLIKPYIREAMELYTAQFQPKWIPVSEVFPPFGTLVLLRGVIDWKGEAGVSYFSDEVENDYEILEYGRTGYLLKSNSDYLVVEDPNPEEVCSEYITHWMPLPQPPKGD